MTTPLQRDIVAVLGTAGGNVRATAARLHVSEEYVRQVADRGLVTRDENVSDSTPLIDELRRALPAPNAPAIANLRDSVIESLQGHVDDGTMGAAALIALLKILLSHEGQIWAVIRPAVNVVTDRETRTFDLTVLVDKLQSLDQESLRAIASGRIVEPG